MPNLGRDRIWNPEIWKEIDKAVLAEVGRIRVAQKVFPSVRIPDAAYVSGDVFDPDTGSIREGQTSQLLEISREFRLTQSQVDNEPTLRHGRTLARLMAKEVASMEDFAFFRGDKSVAQFKTDAETAVRNAKAAGTPPPTPGIERVSVINFANDFLGQGGLLGVADAYKPITVSSTKGAPAAYGVGTFNAVGEGVATLTGAGQPGPFALFVPTEIFGDASRALANTTTTTVDLIARLVTGGTHLTPVLPPFASGPPSVGLLVSLAGEPTTIYIAQDATTAFTHVDSAGNYHFRVFERVQIVARDKRAIVQLDFR
jgi:uncharacterized linocin/CFP29 family protein